MASGWSVTVGRLGDCNPFASNGASEGTFESNLDDRGISRVYMGTGQFGGYGGLDKIFATNDGRRRAAREVDQWL